MTNLEQNEPWYQTSLDIYLNRWFANYEAAREALEEHGEFLLPYRHHFYVCKAEVITALGLDPADPDWKKIGFDCARPADEEAFRRLLQKREAVIKAAESKA